MAARTDLDTLCPSKVLFAPMVGLSHYAVRESIARFLPEGGKSLWYTEMLSARRLRAEQEESKPELFFRDRSRGLCPQLLGNEAYEIQEAVKKLIDWGAVAIDINMGCPVQKALKHNYGVALMGDIPYAAKVARMAVQASSVPVSVKLRAGLQKDLTFLKEFALALESEGVSWLTLHPRTADQKRRGQADWSQIAYLKTQLKIPLIGNGDVQNQNDIDRMLRTTACDRVMMGRALLSKPWLLCGNSERPGLDYRNFLLSVIEISHEYQSEALSLRKLRFLLYHSAMFLQFGHNLYAEITRAKSLSEARAVVLKFFEKERPVAEETQLLR